MPKNRINIKEATSENLLNPSSEFLWEHGIKKDIPIELIEPNPWNPNELSAEEFNLLAENVGEVGFLDPILLVPLSKEKGKVQRFRIIDGEHRFEQQRLDDVDIIAAVIVDPERFDEREQMRQTARMNKIKGHMNKEKFRKFVDKIITDHGIPADEIAYELGFTDQSEFDAMVQQVRSSLPEEAREEFDRARDEIKTVDDLSLLLNKLFTKYGDTLPYNFMFLDFGGKKSIWVRCKSDEYKHVEKIARECREKDITFDSVLMAVINHLDIGSIIDMYEEYLEKPEKEEEKDIDELMENEDA